LWESLCERGLESRRMRFQTITLSDNVGRQVKTESLLIDCLREEGY
jgi:hypothetical protein